LNNSLIHVPPKAFCGYRYFSSNSNGKGLL
jgi:hypothetical protein